MQVFLPQFMTIKFSKNSPRTSIRLKDRAVTVQRNRTIDSGHQSRNKSKKQSFKVSRSKSMRGSQTFMQPQLNFLQNQQQIKKVDLFPSKDIEMIHSRRTTNNKLYNAGKTRLSFKLEQKTVKTNKQESKKNSPFLLTKSLNYHYKTPLIKTADLREVSRSGSKVKYRIKNQDLKTSERKYFQLGNECRPWSPTKNEYPEQLFNN